MSTAGLILGGLTGGRSNALESVSTFGLPGFAIHTVSAGLQGAIQEGTTPWLREMRYQSNSTSSNLIPDLDTLTQIWLAGRIDDRIFQQMLSYHGVDWNPGAAGANLTFTERSWNHAVEMMASRHSINDYLRWTRQKRFLPGQLDLMLRHYGFQRQTDRDLFAGQWESFALEEVKRLYIVGKMTRNEAVDRLMEIGFRQADAEMQIDWLAYGYTLEDLIKLKNRGRIGAADYDTGVAALGIRDQKSRVWLDDLARSYPTVSDLILFSTREVWDANVVQRYGYDQEFLPEFRHWATKLGLAWGEAFQLPNGQNVPLVEFDRLHWRSHWRVLAPEQSYRALHRFRPDPNNPGMSVVPGVRAFTSQDVDAMLKINDYAPGVRDWLQALSYNVMRLIDIRNSRILGIQNRDWVVGKLQDRGLTLQDANANADLIESQKERKDKPAYWAWRASAQKEAVKDQVKAYKLGYLGRPLFKTNLQQVGWNASESEQYAAMLDYRLETETVEAVVKAVKRDFWAGKSNEADVMNRLITIGVAQYHANNFLIRWKAEFTETRRMATTSKIIDWLKRGLIDVQTANNRLRNIGWSNTDTLLYLSEASQDIALAAAKSAAAAEANKKKAAKEIEAAIKALEKQKKDLVAQLAKATPIWQMKLWFKKGVIGEDTFRSRLFAMEIPADVVDAYVAEITGETTGVDLTIPDTSGKIDGKDEGSGDEQDDDGSDGSLPGEP